MSLSSFLSSRTGKRFYNLCYCWGACLIILGAVSKIANWPHDNLYLMIGLITEIVIFFISGFEEPAREYKWERVFPILNDKNANIDPIKAASNIIPQQSNTKLVSENYTNNMTKLEDNIKKLSEIYEAQIKQLTSQNQSLSSMKHAELAESTRKMAEYIELLNKQYKQMLGAMNVKSDNKQ